MPRHGPQAGALVSTGGMVETLRLAAVEPILGGEQVEFVTGAVVEAHSSLPVTPAGTPRQRLEDGISAVL
jgi:hypothetical protein